MPQFLIPGVIEGCDCIYVRNLSILFMLGFGQNT